MKTITKTFNIYKFDELNEGQKQAVLEKLWDINVSYDWWNYTYEDATENAGLKITGFDLDRGNCCNIEFIEDEYFTAQQIIKSHGAACDTYKAAINYMQVYNKNNDEVEEADSVFLKELANEYKNLLNQEYEYRLSKEAIIETIKCNDYDFTEDGEIY